MYVLWLTLTLTIGAPGSPVLLGFVPYVLKLLTGVPVATFGAVGAVVALEASALPWPSLPLVWLLLDLFLCFKRGRWLLLLCHLSPTWFFRYQLILLLLLDLGLLLVHHAHAHANGRRD